MLAIGDWGATTDKPGSCCNKYRKTANGSVEFKTDYWAQINVAEILAQSAAAISPVRVIGHGYVFPARIRSAFSKVCLSWSFRF